MVARLKDVAALAGVSVKTASNVVNEYPHVSPATRAKVMAAIERLHYRPNVSARQLKHGRAGFLALALPQLDSPYFAELGARFSAEASRLGYLLLLDATGAEPEAERVVLNGMRTHLVDGVIFSPLAVEARDIADRADTVPMVLLGERAVPPGHDHVAVDSIAASRAMTDHLISLGRTRIAAIGRERVPGTASVRLEGYRQALAAAGLPYRPELVIGVAQYDRTAGKVAMEQLLAMPEPPDAVFCFNDLLAIGALSVVRRRGLTVPEDIALIGWDDIPEVSYSWPPVSSIRADVDQIAAISVDMIIDQLSGERPAELHRTVGYSLIARESTVGPRPGD